MSKTKVAFFEGPVFIQPIRAINLKSIQKALISWKKAEAGLSKSLFRFGHVNWL